MKRIKMSSTKEPPRNGFTANTEGGRIRRMMVTCNLLNTKANTVTDECKSCLPPQTVQPPITPAESSRITLIQTRCGSGSYSGGVTQDRVRELLNKNTIQQQFGPESVRIAKVIQDTVTCATNPNVDTARFSQYNRLAAAEVCPPLPPPPAPPRTLCTLSKNEKY